MTYTLYGLHPGTRTPCVVTIESDKFDLYAVVEQRTRERIMCGFSSAHQAFFWSFLHGLHPVSSTVDLVKTLKLVLQ